jgi:hypothetical protein
MSASLDASLNTQAGQIAEPTVVNAIREVTGILDLTQQALKDGGAALSNARFHMQDVPRKIGIIETSRNYAGRALPLALRYYSLYWGLYAPKTG